MLSIRYLITKVAKSALRSLTNHKQRKLRLKLHTTNYKTLLSKLINNKSYSMIIITPYLRLGWVSCKSAAGTMQSTPQVQALTSWLQQAY